MFASTAHAETRIDQDIDIDTRWDVAGSPYRIAGNVEVLPGITLTIDAGVEVRFDIGTDLGVDGTLCADGTASAPVQFLDAGRLRLAASSVGSVIRFAEFEEMETGLELFSTDVTVEDCRFRNVDDAVRIMVEHAQPTLRRLDFENSVNDDVVAFVHSPRHFEEVRGVVRVTGGTLENAVWPRGMYRVADAIEVRRGHTLTIAPGTLVDFNAPHRRDFPRVKVAGRLHAVGTLAEPVRFAAQGRLQQGVVRLLSSPHEEGADTSAHEIRHATFERMGHYQDWQSALLIETSDVLVESCHFDGCLPHAIRVLGDVEPKIVDASFEGAASLHVACGPGNVTNFLRVQTPIEIKGDLSRDARWPDLELTLVNTVRVEQGVTLTVDAGAEMLLGVSGRLDVRGRLDAVGTAEHPIWFRGPTSSGRQANVCLLGETVASRLHHVSFERLAPWALDVQGLLEPATQLEFFNLSTTAVRVGRGSAVFEKCRFDDIGTFAIENVGPGTVHAERCWWGDASGPTHPTNPSGTGEDVSDGVEFTPWLPAPPTFAIAASSLVPAEGDALTIDVEYGTPFGIGVLLAVEWNGQPISFVVALGPFASDGVFRAVDAIVAPGLAGFAVTLEGLGVDVCQELHITPRLELIFQ